MPADTIASRPWWETGVFYQVYPRSLQDSDGDGVGDLRGIASRLDYFAGLGVGSLWLSPIFRSPMADFGYDVADYEDIDPLFGSLEDFDRLLAGAHARGLRVILDLVPNHTSTEHAWFRESRSSRNSPKRDWYVWADPSPDGGPPNNWISYFGGPAWTRDPATGQYYLHNFDPRQADLNWHNPAVREAIHGALRFWLRRGVDGFRLDVAFILLKDAELRDNPPDPNWKPGDNPVWRLRRVYSQERPGHHELLAGMRAVADEFSDRVLVGEIQYSTDPALMASYYGTAARPEVHQPFNFALIMLPWDARRVREFVAAYDAAVPPWGWPTYVLGNHDQDRLVSRIGSEQARVAAMFLLTVRGAPYIYQGEELGLPNGEVAPEDYQDPQGINVGISRDLCRTPFQWDGSLNAGFTTGKPWLPVSSTWKTLNVESEDADPKSSLSLYRRLLALRRTHPALHAGSMALVESPPDVLAFVRKEAGERFLVALNFSAGPQALERPELGRGKVLLSTAMDREEATDLGGLALRANEGVLIQLD
ncbi:glycoside hydrolase superfamily [Hyaloraphidium curvatum]|nr:glycoside hydrolase superfamily [Hyaloraphidium curvatum]